MPGSRWKNDCNDCWCTETGFSACTLKGCYIQPEIVTAYPSNNLRIVSNDEYNNPNFKCIPNQKFKLECNTCSCLNDGRTSFCTKKGCNNPSNNDELRVVTQEEFNSPNFQCTPNEAFMVDCNRCSCSNDGRNGICTLKGCFGF